MCLCVCARACVCVRARVRVRARVHQVKERRSLDDAEALYRRAVESNPQVCVCVCVCGCVCVCVSRDVIKRT